MARKQTKKSPVDLQIEAVYNARCKGIQIPIMETVKIFEAGRKAAAAGQDVEAAVVAYVASIRTN